MKALVWPRRGDINNPAMKTFSLRAGIGEIMKSGAFLGY